MALKTLAIGLYEVWAHMLCFAKLSPQIFKGSKIPTLRKVNDGVKLCSNKVICGAKKIMQQVPPPKK